MVPWKMSNIVEYIFIVGKSYFDFLHYKKDYFKKRSLKGYLGSLNGSASLQKTPFGTFIYLFVYIFVE